MASNQLPILYSFRRCPYAMRARLALRLYGIPVELREVVLKDKPSQLIEASPKGTVPVLVLEDGTVIDESLDIMLWAIQGLVHKSQDNGQLQETLSPTSAMVELVKRHDREFKPWLDKYKYADRHPELDQHAYRTQAEQFIQELEEKLTQNQYLFSEQPSVADYGIFPFIRQFSSVDKPWFSICPYPYTRRWLNTMIAMPLFSQVMEKYPQWTEEQAPQRF